MPDEGQPHPAAVDPRGRCVGMRTWYPFRPGLALAARAELPAQHVAQRFRRHAVGIEEARTIEMIGRRSGIGLGAAGHFRLRLTPEYRFGQGGFWRRSFTNSLVPIQFLDISG